jgi:hypothetical protein
MRFPKTPQHREAMIFVEKNTRRRVINQPAIDEMDKNNVAQIGVWPLRWGYCGCRNL